MFKTMRSFWVAAMLLFATVVSAQVTTSGMSGKLTDEKKEAIKKAIQLCTEVIDTCGDNKQVDSALNMLTRIYNETGNYEKAESFYEEALIICRCFRKKNNTP